MVSEINVDTLDKILEEIAGYEIGLVEDPTLSEFGIKYIQQCVSKCRQYLNRVQYYLQVCSGQEKTIKKTIFILETDLDLKMKNLITDDPIVRRQPSITDRIAAATSQLIVEHNALSDARIKHQELVETIKIIKMKHRELQSTSSDIKMQRQLIKDEKDYNPEGVPTRNQDGSIPGGLPPTANKQKIEAQDLLDDSKRPDDMPVPKDLGHARQIADFFNGVQLPVKKEETPEEKQTVSNVSYEDLLT